MTPAIPRPAPSGPGALGLALILALGWVVTAAAEDETQPFTHGGSGLISRFVPIAPPLPPDPKRDEWYQTRWADHPPGKHVNSVCDGGLYGRRWPSTCTKCVAPYFRGYPGCSSIDPACEPNPHKVLRRVENLVHPFRPVGSYYAGGCSVPIYDLDPGVPGPGPLPWPHFFRKPTGG